MLKVMLLTCRRKIEAPVEHTYVCCRPSEKRRYLGPVFWGLMYRYAFPERKRVCNQTYVCSKRGASAFSFHHIQDLSLVPVLARMESIF